MRKPSGEDFNSLALRLKDGDRRAGGIIFDAFAPSFFGFFLQRVGMRNVAEDLVQETFTKLMKRIETFDPSLGAFTPWFWQVARNTLNDYFRERKNPLLSEVEIEQGENFETDESLDAKAFVAEILEEVKKFAEEEQELFFLRYVQGLSYREISKILGKTEVSARVAAHRIVKKIRGKYQ